MCVYVEKTKSLTSTLAHVRRDRRTTRNKTWVLKDCASFPGWAGGLSSGRGRIGPLVLMCWLLDDDVWGFTEDLINWEYQMCEIPEYHRKLLFSEVTKKWAFIWGHRTGCLKLDSKEQVCARCLRSAVLSIPVRPFQMRWWDSLGVRVWHRSFSPSLFLKEHQEIVQLLSLS